MMKRRLVMMAEMMVVVMAMIRTMLVVNIDRDLDYTSILSKNLNIVYKKSTKQHSK